MKADISPATCVIIEDNGRRSLKKVVESIRAAGGSLIYLIRTASTTRRTDELRAHFPDVNQLSIAELMGTALVTELSRSVTRARVQQYQRYFEDAAKVLILLHNDPDPDAMASGLDLRYLAAHQDHGHHRRAAGDDAPREPADGQPARHQGRAGHPGPVRRLRAAEELGISRPTLYDLMKKYGLHDGLH